MPGGWHVVGEEGWLERGQVGSLSGEAPLHTTDDCHQIVESARWPNPLKPEDSHSCEARGLQPGDLAGEHADMRGVA